jgi:hypothetical protein
MLLIIKRQDTLVLWFLGILFLCTDTKFDTLKKNSLSHFFCSNKNRYTASVVLCVAALLAGIVMAGLASTAFCSTAFY